MPTILTARGHRSSMRFPIYAPALLLATAPHPPPSHATDFSFWIRAHAHDCDRKTGRPRGFWHRLVSGCAMCRCGCKGRQRVPRSRAQVVRAGVRSEPRKWNTRVASSPPRLPFLPPSRTPPSLTACVIYAFNDRSHKSFGLYFCVSYPSTIDPVSRPKPDTFSLRTTVFLNFFPRST
ncbi:hypothetical protein DFH06DRAFT_578279 [Mycena polygramma]|nr:hypothetical protein DFH06DRAFT_578279 [Mycena polygramma]